MKQYNIDESYIVDKALSGLPLTKSEHEVYVAWENRQKRYEEAWKQSQTVDNEPLPF